MSTPSQLSLCHRFLSIHNSLPSTRHHPIQLPHISACGLALPTTLFSSHPLHCLPPNAIEPADAAYNFQTNSKLRFWT